jgi:hypothetical protein
VPKVLKEVAVKPAVGAHLDMSKALGVEKCMPEPEMSIEEKNLGVERAHILELERMLDLNHMLSPNCMELAHMMELDHMQEPVDSME